MKKKRIVIKVGSGVITEANNIAKERMLSLVTLIAEFKKTNEVILVTSGAVSAGYTALQLDRKRDISKKVLASVGQPILMTNYKRMFDIFDINISQILLTEEDFDSRVHTVIFQQIIETTLANGILPIVNENDISTTEDQLFGDNDQLASHITHYTNSDLLVLLSDIDGYYDDNPSKNPDAKIIKEVHSIDAAKLMEDHTPNNKFATGGIVTKLKAAQYLMNRNRQMFLCSGYDLSTIKDYVLDGVHEKGSLFSRL
ncbi:glutamate 5-kinase [Rubritalea sp.]|uniref:glutamate 5-kinase n=1 Tax=Rubritalea sp. TaxID=2109375 RepID=UPI003EF24175